MDFDSSVFDSIRIKPKRKKEKASKPDTSKLCAWEGCDKPGSHKAPAGRNQEGQYLYFCLEHVRDYNKNYNYFNGMNDDDLKAFQKQSITGHRPTWKMGVNKQAQGSAGQAHVDPTTGRPSSTKARPFTGFHKKNVEDQKDGPRHVGVLARRAFKRLSLDQDASAKDIKERYKQLVKKLHPDANGGDRGHEDRLREVIQAYNQLKSSGFC